MVLCFFQIFCFFYIFSHFCFFIFCDFEVLILFYFFVLIHKNLFLQNWRLEPLDILHRSTSVRTTTRVIYVETSYCCKRYTKFYQFSDFQVCILFLHILCFVLVRYIKIYFCKTGHWNP